MANVLLSNSKDILNQWINDVKTLIDYPMYSEKYFAIAKEGEESAKNIYLYTKFVSYKLYDFADVNDFVTIANKGGFRNNIYLQTNKNVSEILKDIKDLYDYYANRRDMLEKDKEKYKGVGEVVISICNDQLDIESKLSYLSSRLAYAKLFFGTGKR